MLPAGLNPCPGWPDCLPAHALCLPTVQVFPGEGPSQFDQTIPMGSSQVDAQHGTFLDRFLSMGGTGPILVSAVAASAAVAAAST